MWFLTELLHDVKRGRPVPNGSVERLKVSQPDPLTHDRQDRKQCVGIANHMSNHQISATIAGGSSRLADVRAGDLRGRANHEILESIPNSLLLIGSLLCRTYFRWNVSRAKFWRESRCGVRINEIGAIQLWRRGLHMVWVLVWIWTDGLAVLGAIGNHCVAARQSGVGELVGGFCHCLGSFRYSCEQCGDMLDVLFRGSRRPADVSRTSLRGRSAPKATAGGAASRGLIGLTSDQCLLHKRCSRT